MDREQSCSFTGHRPEKLPWGARETDPRCVTLKRKLQEEVQQAYTQGYRHFLCGMARGTDLYFGEAVVQLRTVHPEITLEAVIPYATQASRWSQAEQIRYQALLDQCNDETVIQHHYTRGCIQRRNRYLVDHASRILAVYDGLGGGTMYTLGYAMQQNLDVVILAP